MGKEIKYYGVIKVFLIVFFCILTDVAGRAIAVKFTLPMWLDCGGTVFAAYVLGPVCGSIVGVTYNVIFTFWNPVSMIFSVTSILIGICVGYNARRGYFSNFFKTMILAGNITVAYVLINTFINMLLFKGNIGNIWGDGVREYLIEKGIFKIIACMIGQLYIDFLDKVLVIMTMYFIIKLHRYVKKSGKVGILKVIFDTMLFAFFSSLLLSTHDVSAYADDLKKDAEKSYIQTVYNSQNGLPCGHANAITHTNDGILWVGTYAGLYQYDGNDFKFMSEYKTVKNVNTLFVDSEGRLWIGTNDNGIVIAINRNISNVIDSTQGLTSDSIRCFTQSSDGEYYVGTANGIQRIRIASGITLTGSIKEIGYVDSISSDNRGNIAAVNGDGNLYFIKQGKIVDKRECTDKNDSFSSCIFGKDGTLYTGNANGVIKTYSLDYGVLTERESIQCEGISKINRISIKDDNTFWICADNGIGLLKDKKTFIKQETGEFNYSVQDMDIDYQGNLWFASTRIGLLRLSQSAFTDIFSDVGLEASVVNTTKLRDNLLYIGSDDGLNIVNVDNNIVVENNLTDMMKNTRIRCITDDSDGNLWICSYGKGVIKYDNEGNITVFDSDSHVGKRVRVCIQMSDGRMAVGGDSGLSFIKDDKVIFNIPYGEEFCSAKILCMIELKDGTLLCGTDGNGIVGVKDNKLVKKVERKDGLGSGVILRMVSDKDTGNIFIVTSNSISYYDGNEVRLLDNFPYSNNYDIVINDRDEMLIPGSSGIYVVNREDLLSGKKFEYTVLNSRMGLMGSLTANAYNDVDEDNNLFLSSNKGVYKVNLDEYKEKIRSYRLMVSEVRLDDKKHSIERGTVLKVDRSVNKIEITPEIINYTFENPTVSYYLEGVDSGWINVPQSELSSVVYTNLPSGDYVFHLAIFDNETGRIVEESSYRIEKEKSIYDNSWFHIYMIVVGILFVGWISWFATRTRLQRTLAIQQTQLSLALQQIQMGNETIIAIAKTVDAKDKLTSKHSQRVSEYSVLIASEYGFSKDEQENLRRAALLHDIGKIAIPDSILNKPARLTNEEYEVMKTHVIRGAEILKDFTLIDHVVEGAKYHHERFDGLGYPEGLKGKDIPLYGRIIAIADAFDAMTANRVYRKKQNFDFVISELKNGRGTQFDPDLIDIFNKLIDDKKINIDAIYRIEREGEDNNE